MGDDAQVAWRFCAGEAGEVIYVAGAFSLVISKGGPVLFGCGVPSLSVSYHWSPLAKFPSSISCGVHYIPVVGTDVIAAMFFFCVCFL